MFTRYLRCSEWKLISRSVEQYNLLMRELDVYANNQKAGILKERSLGGECSFCHDVAYLVPDGPSISATSSKMGKPCNSSGHFPFFTNMLPEGANHRVICRLSGVDESDFFGLLSAMAWKDFIGGAYIENISR